MVTPTTAPVTRTRLTVGGNGIVRIVGLLSSVCNEQYSPPSYLAICLSAIFYSSILSIDVITEVGAE